MASSMLDKLPLPPLGKTGFPWTEGCNSLPALMPNGKPYPRISIVTPSFNQGQFIEETIRSILLQGYPNLEYIIIDGCSTDNTVEIIRKYEPWLTYWVSEPDRGQTHAINKGIEHSTGEIFHFINSDDVLMPNVLGKVAHGFKIVGGDAVAGAVLNFGERWKDNDVILLDALTAKGLIDLSSTYHQPGFWMSLQKLKAAGGFDESLHYSFDWDLTIRYLYYFPIVTYFPDVFIKFRLHETSKSVTVYPRFDAERSKILQNLLKESRFKEIHDSCDLRLRQEYWWSYLNNLEQQEQAKHIKALKIIGQMCLDPKVRFTRLSIGIIYKYLSQQWKPKNGI